MRVVLAGAAAVGKTSTAVVLSHMTGLPYRMVEARECWHIWEPLPRQRCFLDVFSRSISAVPGVYDNSLLTVYGYTMHFAEETGNEKLYKLALAALKKWELLEKKAVVVVLRADKTAMAARLVGRRISDEERRRHWLESRLRPHLEAQRYIVEEARARGLPVVDTTLSGVHDVAERVAVLAGVPRVAAVPGAAGGGEA